MPFQMGREVSSVATGNAYTAQEPDATVPAGSSGDSRSVSAAVAVVVLTLAVGVFGQGAFYRAGQVVVAVGIATSVVVSVVARRPRLREFARAPLPALSALSAWIVLDAALHGSFRDGAAGGALTLAVVAMLFVVCRSSEADRDLLVSTLPVLGGWVALTAWLGLVLHLPRWGLLAQGVWRGAGTLSYPNATAAVLVSLALLAVARSTAPAGPIVDRAGPVLVPARTTRLLATAMLLGAGSTLSRGGLAALAVGLMVAAAFGGLRMLRAATGPLAGAAVAVVGALPTTASTGPVRVLLATSAAVMGGIVCERVTRLVSGAKAPAPDRHGHRRHAVIRATAPALAVWGVTVAVVLLSFGPTVGLGALAHARLTAGSAHRVDAALAAVDEIRRHPLVGVGPGPAGVTWHDADGGSRTLRYVHDEYLQLVLDTGTIGGALLVIAAGAGVRAARRGLRGVDRYRSSATWAGGAAAVTAFAVHSAFDFLWRLPALPLLTAAVFAAALDEGDRTGPGTPANHQERTIR